jgi:hypothetical protein
LAAVWQYRLVENTLIQFDELLVFGPMLLLLLLFLKGMML